MIIWWQREMQTAEQLVPEHDYSEAEIATDKLETYKSPGTN